MKMVNESTRCSYTMKEAGVALMEINNPPMNALSWAVLGEIQDTFVKALNDPEVRVIVFTGAGKAFIAGADISELNDYTTAQEGADSLIRCQELSHLLMNADKPVIAAINGFCLGGGMEMALACHIRLADESATLGLPEIKLGIIPGYGGTQRTPRLIGQSRALELILSGNFFEWQTGRSIWLGEQGGAKGDRSGRSHEARRYHWGQEQGCRPGCFAGGLRGIGHGPPYWYEARARLFGTCYASEDKKEGAAAFMEKRTPKFKDR